MAKPLNFYKKGLVLLCSFFVLSNCEDQPRDAVVAEAIRPKQLLSRALYSAQFQLDPHFVTAAADGAPLRDLLVGLMAFNERGEVVPALATQWFSEDGKEWLFMLKENAFWSNQQAVKAHDFVASWQRLINPQNHSPLAHYLVYMGVENAKAIINGEQSPDTLGIEVLNDTVLKIRLQQPNYQLPQMLAHSALLPTYQGKPTNRHHFVSNGAYRLANASDKELYLEAQSAQQPFLQVHYQLLTSIQNTQRFDIIENPLANHQLNEVILPRLCTYFYEFNFTDPQLQSKPIRQAIKAMLSPAEISRDIGLANNAILPKSLRATPESYQSVPLVEQLLSQAGVSAATPLRLTVTFDNTTQHQVIANRIIRTLAQSDLFRIQPKAVEWQTLLALREQQNFQLIRSGWCADYPDAAQFLLPFHSASPDNKSRYRNEAVDNLLEQIQLTANTEQRQQLIQQAAQLLENDVAIIPIFQYQRRLSINSTLRGIDLTNSSEVIYSKDLYRQ